MIFSNSIWLTQYQYDDIFLFIQITRLLYEIPFVARNCNLSNGNSVPFDDKSMMRSPSRFAVARDCSRSFSHLSLFPISQGNVRLGYSAVGFPNSGNFSREIKRAKWERENHAVKLYDSSAHVTRELGEKTNVVTDRIDRAAIDDCVQDLHFEGEHYATLYGQRQRTGNARWTLDLPRWRR